MDDLQQLATRMLNKGLFPLHKENFLFFLRIAYFTGFLTTAVFTMGYFVGHTVP